MRLLSLLPIGISHAASVAAGEYNPFACRLDAISSKLVTH